MKSWVFAADSAKIATLESVAEKVEEGQLALEDSMKILGEVDRLLGRSRPGRTERRSRRHGGGHLACTGQAGDGAQCEEARW